MRLPPLCHPSQIATIEMGVTTSDPFPRSEPIAKSYITETTLKSEVWSCAVSMKQPVEKQPVNQREKNAAVAKNLLSASAPFILRGKLPSAILISFFARRAGGFALNATHRRLLHLVNSLG